MVVAVLFMAGVHAPAIPLAEVDGNVMRVPVQIVSTMVKAGVIFEVISTVIEADTAHCPGPGVNV